MRSDFVIKYLFLVVAQMLICDVFDFSGYVTLSILPVMILCLPAKCGTMAAMLIAFPTGLAVDFLAEGLPGLNAAALVPVALCRKSIARFVFGREALDEDAAFSPKRFGTEKGFFAIALVQSLFLATYILLDGAAARPLVFSALRFVCSLLAGSLLSLVVAGIMNPEGKGRWS